MERIGLTMQKTQVPSLGRDDPLEKEMATHSCLGNPMGRGAWQAAVQGVTKQLDRQLILAWENSIVLLFMLLQICFIFR